ncbi:MAG: hypothetical protein KGR46_06335 [Verrucomicrobia bacterium]|nr:hypothetical protein [Verrucomicrobiota bacterium]
MNRRHSTISLAALLVSSAVLHAEPAENPAAPWLTPRSMDNFRVLLDRSPFSLPTAEEAAPEADRYFLTGAATINDEPVVFVFDKNTQVRHMLGRTPNASNDRLVEYTPAMTPKDMRARVRIGGVEFAVNYGDPGGDASQPSQQIQQIPPMQPPPPQAAGAPVPPIPPTPQQPGIQPATGATDTQPPRRVIRRRVISNQPPVAPPQQGP